MFQLPLFGAHLNTQQHISNKMFKRKIYDSLLEWKKIDDGKTALLVEGARRIGKTTIVKEFAKNEYESYVLIDFSDDTDECAKLFKKPFGNLDQLFQKIQLYSGVALYERKSVIIFDEIQLEPKARQLIKSLVLDGRYDYIETGSLISLRKSVKNIRIPSEEHRVQMYPMDFEEWLWAHEDNLTLKILKDIFEKKEQLGRYVHEALLEKYKTYMIVGGMPQVVDEFLKTNNYMMAERRKKEILDLYREDIEKSDKNNSIKIKAIFDAIPTMLSNHNNSFSPGKVMPGSRSRSFTEAIKWLIEAKYVYPCYCCNDPDIAIGLTADRSKLKLYFLDTGLLFSLAFEKNTEGLRQVFKEFLTSKVSLNSGMFFENSVAQQLVILGNDLYFYEFNSENKRYEIDFILPSGNGIDVIEVKSSISSKHKSLDIFRKKYSKRVKKSYIIHKKDFRFDSDILFIPIYMALCLK